MNEIIWHDESLGVISWDSRVKGYVLRIDRRDDPPLSFNVWTKIGTDAK